MQAWRPDVLVSDIEMPGEDGYALIRKVRSLPADQGGEVPAIALTAYGRTQDRVRSLAQWMPELGLPRFDDGELVTLLPELCAGARSFAELAERPLVEFLKARMDRRALSALEREAPERIQVPSGSFVRLV